MTDVQKTKMPTAGHSMARFETAARGAIAEGQIPGVVAMAANADELLYAVAIGDRGVPGKGPLAVDDVFYIASMTKAVTCFAGVQMIEQGKLGLDMRAADLLPELREVKVLTGFDAAGQPRFREPRSEVQVRHLFTHTSGLSTDVWNENIKRYSADFNVPSMATCKNAALDVPLVFDPGERWEYSVAIDFIGKIVETLSGHRLEDYFRKFIFEPLGMNWTSFILRPEQRERLVPVWSKADGGDWKRVAFEISQEPEFYMGGAGLCGTAGDYIRFLRMLLNRGSLDGNRVARPDTVALYLDNHLGDLTVAALPTAMPFLSVDVEFLPGNPKKWSLGAMINSRDVPGGRRAGAQFWAGLASTYFWLDPESDLAGLTMLSYFPFADPAGVAIFDAFERDVYASYG
jgi:CubicO group peptidase (beta-lactamase class C family)